MNKKRNELPLFGKIKIDKIDLEKLQNDCKILLDNNMFSDLNKTNVFYDKMLNYRNYLLNWFKNDNEIKNGLNPSNYYQLNLTDLEKNVEDLNTSFREQDSDVVKNKRTVDSKSKYYLYQSDERNYTKINNNCPSGVIDLLGKLKGKYGRVRLSLMKPNFQIKPHIDNNTSYSVRLHLPIFTNENCFFYLKDRKKDMFHKFNMPINDNYLYFINTGYVHYAENMGKSDRLHLIITMSSQEDLNNIETIIN